MSCCPFQTAMKFSHNLYDLKDSERTRVLIETSVCLEVNERPCASTRTFVFGKFHICFRYFSVGCFYYIFGIYSYDTF